MSPRYLALLFLLPIVTPTIAAAQTDEDPYRQAMGKCEEAKQKGEFPAMAAAIREALKHGPGNEYAWRSLAWALDRAGQWEESLAVAIEYGQQVVLERGPDGPECRAYANDGHLLAILHHLEGNVWQPHKVFSRPTKGS